MQAQIRLLLKDLSNMGLHCLSFHLKLVDLLLPRKPKCSIARTVAVIILGIPIYRFFFS